MWDDYIWQLVFALLMSYPTFLPALALGDRYIVQPLNELSDNRADCVVVDTLDGSTCTVQTILTASKTQAIVYCQYLRKLMSLSLPQVEQVKDCFTSDRTIVVVKRQIAGQFYSDIITEVGRLTEQDAALFLKQVLTILSALHQNGMRHCNLSLETICLRANDNLPVLTQPVFFQGDATNAKLSRSASLQSQAFALTGLAAPRDDRADLYSVALATLELLTGQPLSVLFNLQTAQWDWNSFCSVSPDLAKLLNRMLSARVSDWFVSADEFLFALSLVRLEAVGAKMQASLAI